MTLHLYYKLSFIILFFTAGVIVAGITSNISLGDEPYHFDFARAIYKNQSRPLYETNATSPVSKRIILAPPFWHSILAFIWTILGNINIYAAQIYQGGFYALYIFASFLLSKELYGDKTGLLASLYAATTPFAIAYSIMLYQDVALAALAVMSIWLFLKGRLWWAGIVLGLMLATKQNGILFIPGIILLLFMNPRGFKDKIRDSFKLFIPVLIIIAPDIYYRIAHIQPHSLSIFHNAPLVHYPKFYPLVKADFVHPSDILGHPFLALGYIGIPTIISLILFFVLKCWEKKDVIPAVIIATYSILFLFLFWKMPAARYLAPILPFINITVPKVIGKLLDSDGIKNKAIKKIIVIILIAGCFIQYAVGAAFIHNKRTIPEELMEAYDFVRENINTNGSLLSIERAVSIYTGRKTTYHSEASLYEIGYLFFEADEEEVADILYRHNISHLFIKKNRIYQDTPYNRHILGFPKSLIERLNISDSYFKKIFENNEAIIFELIPLNINKGISKGKYELNG